MAPKSSLAVVPQEPKSGVRLQTCLPLTDRPSVIESLENARFLAANSPDVSVRKYNIMQLADIDSFGIIAETSSYADARDQAKDSLRNSLSTYPDASIAYLAQNAHSRAIKAAASEELAKREKLNI